MADEILPTQSTLLVRLKDWEDDQSWREFFDLYWRLIYGTAIKAGCTQTEAEEVLQETVITVAKEIKRFDYDRGKGRFKAWLLEITRRRIAGEIRKRPRAAEAAVDRLSDSSSTGLLERIPDPSGFPLESIWEDEWQQNLMAVALDRLKPRLKPKYGEICERLLLNHRPVAEVARDLKVPKAKVYWVKHTVLGRLKQEVKRLEPRLL